MRLATQYDRIHGAGAELISISVDDDVRQAGMAQRWGLHATGFHSDPDGERFLKPLDLFDPEERGGIALPALVLVDPDGNEVHRYAGRDFADRTGDEDVFQALEGLGLPAIEAPTHDHDDVDVPDDLRGYFRPANIQPYFLGNMYAALTIGWRIGEDEAAAVAKEHRAMAKSILDALDEWKGHIQR